MGTKEPNQMQASNIPASDEITKNKSIYDVSGFEVFWRNFIAGASRAVGTIFVYVFLFAAVFTFINKFLMPHILPLVETMQTSIESLNNLSPNKPQNKLVEDALNRPELQNILEQVSK